MPSIRFIASVATISAAALFGLSGCIIGECEDGQANCISLEPGTTYTDTDELTATYVAGNDLLVSGFNGQIEIRSGSASGQVAIETVRKTLEEGSAEGEERAERQLEEELRVTVSDDGDVVVQTERLSNDGNLAVDLTILLPSDFDGRIQVVQNNGSVDLDLAGVSPAGVSVLNDGAGGVAVAGARGVVDIQGGFDVEVGLASWPEAASRVVSTGGLGDVTVQIPADANGTLQATVDDAASLTVPEPLPAGWVDNGGGAFTLGDGTGAALTVTARRSITLL
ncbi:MAG: hypothetical protein AAGN82_03010 [Myxococcota bacterium]